MNRHEVAGLMFELGIRPASNRPSYDEMVGKFTQFAEIVAAKNSEECAKICLQLDTRDVDESFAMGVQECAAAIRAAGEK